MGRRRKNNKHLPPRVYESRGKLYYSDPVTLKWIPLPEGLRTWAKIIDAAEPTHTLSALWARFDLEVLAKKAPKTRRNRLQEWSQVEPVFGAMRAEDVETHHVWRYWRERGETEGAKHEVRCLSVLLTYALQCGARKQSNPCFGLRLVSVTGGRRDRYVTDEEFIAVRALATSMIGYAMDIAFVAGMSQIDILTLERKQDSKLGLEFDRKKTGKPQVIEWNDDLRSIVATAQRHTPQVRRTLICTRDGTGYTSNGFQAVWQRLQRRAFKEGKISERYTFHDLRAKSLSDAESIEEARKRGGHVDDTITKRHYRRLPMVGKALKILGNG